MPGLCYQPKVEKIKIDHHHTKVVCNCKSCPCKNFESKRLVAKTASPANGIVFQLPRYREPRTDTYSHTVYRKEMCNRFLMKQHAALAQKKINQRPKQPPVFEQERFNYKSLTDTDYRKYNPREAATCKTKFPRIKRKEDFYYSPGEFSCTAKFPQQSLSHDDYCPKVPIPSTLQRGERECAVPPFKGLSSYDRDYKPPPLDAYSVTRKARKRVIFD